MAPKMIVREIPFSKMILLPPHPDVCQECAVLHPPEQPHNQQSLYYQYYFYRLHDRWPTWKDAMSHCDPGIRQQWVEALMNMNVAPFTIYRNWGNPEVCNSAT